MERERSIKLYNAAIEDGPKGEGIVIRGVLDNDTLGLLKIDTYQRKLMSLRSRGKIIKALETGQRLPDVEVGLRGEDFYQRDDAVYLHDPAFIIDGQQRVLTILEHIDRYPEARPRIGAVVWLNSTREWERDRFHELNNSRNKLSPNILLNNARETQPAVLMLYGLCHNDKTFPLYGRVCWEQNMGRGTLITAMTMARAATELHRHHKGVGGRASVDETIKGLARGRDLVGLQHMRANIQTFYNLVEYAWGIRAIEYRQAACHMRLTFLLVLATLLQRHHDFWIGEDEKRLQIPSELARKFKLFAIHDPEVMRLSGAGGKAKDVLYMMLRDHINSGKRTKRLRERDLIEETEVYEEEKDELLELV